MYTKYFGFNEKPFTLTPNPRFIFLSKNHKEAFAHLLYGINNHYGFIELVGEVGTGKTTVLRTLLGQLREESYRSALIFNPCLSGVELLRSINQEYGLDASSEYANELLTHLNHFLLNENSSGRTVVLVIDEAQNLQPEVLEQIRLISNLETENEKLIQIILAGQPELEALLQRPDLRQLNQRIAVRYKLKPMSMDETKAYIGHRMEVAGDTGGVTFGRLALKWIYLYTRGVPRMINILCDRALLIAYGDERRSITAGIVSRAIKEILNLPRERKMFSPRVAAFSALAAVTLLLIVAARWFPFPERIPSVFSSTADTAQNDTKKMEDTATISGAVRPGEPASLFEQELTARDQNETHLRAFNALATTWGAQPVKVFDGKLKVPETFSFLATRRNLNCTRFQGTLDEAISLNLPFLMETTAKGWMGNYYIAVMSIDRDTARIAPALYGNSTIKRKDLARLSSGTHYLVWENRDGIPSKINFGERRYEIRSLQRYLRNAGYYRGEIDGDYSNLTQNATLEFQRSRKIAPDDTVGETTLAALTAFNTSRTVPKLNLASRKQ